MGLAKTLQRQPNTDDLRIREPVPPAHRRGEM
jgi:hypothetical protein